MKTKQLGFVIYSLLATATEISGRIFQLGLPVIVGVAIFITDLTGAEAEPVAEVFRVHAAVTYRVTRPPTILERAQLKGEQTLVMETRQCGTGFLVRASEQMLVVTAAHVLTGRWPVGSLQFPGETITLAHGGTKLVNATARIRLGDLSVHPLRIALDPDSDLAVISVNPDHVQLLGARALTVSPAAVHSMEEVQAWGFPGTASIQLSPRFAVTEVGAGFLVLAGSLGAGYSGGPVVNNTGVIGVVARDDGIQARIVTVDKLQALLSAFAVRSQPYIDDMQVSGLVGP